MEKKNITEKKTSIWAKVILVSVAALVLMSIISDVIELGERLSNVTPVLAYIVYGLVGLVVIFGIIYPIFGVFTAPIFSLEKLHNEDGTARKKWCKKLVNNLVKNVDLTEEEKIEVIGYMECKDETDDKLIEFFDRKIRPMVNEEVADSAKKVLVITAISQNSLYDMLGMAVSNFNLVKRIVEICGFRPTTPQVVKLYIRILSMTFMAGTLEDVNIEEWIEGAAGKAGGLVVASLTQGALNALNTLRIGSITKNYLLNANTKQTKKELRRKSYIEAAGMLKDIIAKTVSNKLTSPFANVFKKKKEE